MSTTRHYTVYRPDAPVAEGKPARYSGWRGNIWFWTALPLILAATNAPAVLHGRANVIGLLVFAALLAVSAWHIIAIAAARMDEPPDDI